MYVKKCPHCGEKTYSASKKGMWRCATCGGDISNVEPKSAGKKVE